MLSGNNGIIKITSTSKEQSEISNEKEIIEISTTQAMGQNKYGNLNDNELKKQLDNYLGDENLTTIDNEDGKIIVSFTKTGHSYLIDSDGNIEKYEAPQITEIPPKSTTIASIDRTMRDNRYSIFKWKRIYCYRNTQFAIS